MSKRINIDELKPGMVIVQITRQNGPVKIRKSGLVTSEAMVQGLAEMGVQQVEVDLDQTVEIAPVAQHRTQTQALLRGQYDTSANFDKSLSEQFNRSLFLPTVEGLPSLWKVYGRELVIYALVTIVGIGIGFSAATKDLWWPGMQASVVNNASPNVVTSPETSLESNEPSQNAGNSNQIQSTPTQEVERLANTTISQQETETAAMAAPKSSLEQTNPNDEQNQDNSKDSVNEDVLQSELALAEQEGRVLTAPQEQNVSVSPELLERFNQAIAALDNQSDDDAEPETIVTVRDDIKRVDQLPARLLTRLPAMSFSAHMYASRPRDRWVRVNGEQLGEGDWIDGQVQIINIEAQRVVLSFEGELFTMAALTDW